MKEINLKEILRQNCSIYNNNIEVDEALAAMKEACKQVLELAAENAELQSFELEEDWMEEPFDMTKDDYGNIRAISKQSILNTINQVK